MKKKIFAVFFMLMLSTICQSEAAIVYELEITNIDYTGVTDNLDTIAGFESNISGDAGTDWVIGMISSRYAGDIWFFDEGIGADPTFFGGVDDTSNQDVWLLNGIVLQIISPNDTALTLSNFVAFDYDAGDYPGTVTASLNVVPIPSTIILLGGGLISLVALRRRRSQV